MPLYDALKEKVTVLSEKKPLFVDRSKGTYHAEKH